MKRQFFSILLIVLMLGALAFSAAAGTFEAMSTTGVLDADGAAFLQGNVMLFSGDLIQLIWAGPNGVAEDPDSLGNATGDDAILDSTFIGYGFPFNPDEGKFSVIWTDDLITLGNVVYLRAWNSPAVLPDEPVYFGNSELYTLPSSDMNSHDFRTFQVTQAMHTPVELASFTAASFPGMIQVNWVTQSETDNLGFHLYRALSPNGEKQQITDRLIEGAMNSSSRHEYTFTDRNIEDQVVYYYWLADIALDGQTTFNGPRTAVAVAKPTEYLLAQNYPNPFNPSTSISYTLKDNGHVKLAIFNIRGQLIRSLVDNAQMAGQYSMEWDGRDANGSVVPTGTYFYSLEINGFKAVRRMTMAK
ncbi:MAG TPA: FlgD immunoglobulin-like domain containing protein [bacterium]|nr:FlgD immunoglobulin-like domain containing protein [bacterium]